MNSYTVAGRLGKDPESRQVGEHLKCTFSIATNYFQKGEKQTTWHNIECWGKQADNCMKYLKKGSIVGASGEFRINKYNDQNGNPKEFPFMASADVSFLADLRQQDNNQGGGGGGGYQGNNNNNNNQGQQNNQGGYKQNGSQGNQNYQGNNNNNNNQGNQGGQGGQGGQGQQQNMSYGSNQGGYNGGQGGAQEDDIPF